MALTAGDRLAPGARIIDQDGYQKIRVEGAGGGGGDASAANQQTEITRLTEIRDYVDTVETNQATQTTRLTEIRDYLDTVETSQATQTTRLTEIRDYVDTVEAKLQTLIDNTPTLIVPKFASISTASSGQTSIVAAVSGKKIQVLGYTIVAGGSVNVKFQSGSTDLTGAMEYVVNTGAAPIGGRDCPLFETAVNTVLNINLSAAVNVRGHLTYIEV